MEKVCIAVRYNDVSVHLLVFTWQVLLPRNVSFICVLLTGLWHYRPLQSLPSLVLAGSSNFGKYSHMTWKVVIDVCGHMFLANWSPICGHNICQ